MSVYLITWNFNKEVDYSFTRRNFIQRLQQLGAISDPGLHSVSFLATNLSSDQLYNDLCRYFDKNDKIIVTKMKKGEHQGWMSQTTWRWINAKL